jgi:hypothetical protein
MADEFESSAGDVGGAADFAASGLDKVTGEIGSAGAFDRTDIHDPQQLLEYKRAKIEADHEGLRGLAGSVESKLFHLPTLEGEMSTLSDAERYSSIGDARSSADATAHEQSDRLRQLMAWMDAQVAAAGKTGYQQGMDDVNQQYSNALQTADQIANNRTAWSQGFKNQAEADQFADHLRKDATAIHDAQWTKLQREKLIQEAGDQARLGILNREAAGDTTGAARAALEMQLDASEDAIDPNDKQRLEMFARIRRQSLANFDADLARQNKLQDEHFDDQMAQFREESKEAKLRAAGKSDEADAAHLQFETNEQAKWYREQADAETDPEKKKRLLMLAQAAEAAGKDQRDALQQEQQRHNTQSPALDSTSHAGPTLDDALVTKLTDATKKLDDAVAKLDRALAGPNKPLTSVKD